MAEEQMVKVDLNESLGIRKGGTGVVKLYGPGKGISVPKSLADALGLQPTEQMEAQQAAIAQMNEGAGNATEPPAAPAGDDEGGDDEGEFASWTKGELKEEAEARGLKVTRADGKDGDPLRSDYIAALSTEG